MAERIKNGERLLMVGGPMDGQYRAAERLLEFLGGGILPAGISFGEHFYRLDQESRRWIYEQQQKGPGDG